jgi:uncharacterized protein
MTSTLSREAGPVNRTGNTIVDTDIHPHALPRDIVPRLVPARRLARGRLPGQRPADDA